MRRQHVSWPERLSIPGLPCSGRMPGDAMDEDDASDSLAKWRFGYERKGGILGLNDGPEFGLVDHRGCVSCIMF